MIIPSHQVSEVPKMKVIFFTRLHHPLNVWNFSRKLLVVELQQLLQLMLGLKPLQALNRCRNKVRVCVVWSNLSLSKLLTICNGEFVPTGEKGLGLCSIIFCVVTVEDRTHRL